MSVKIKGNNNIWIDFKVRNFLKELLLFIVILNINPTSN